jgi:site-specific DNA recombinase
MKAAAYLRVSTEEQRERQTIETQRQIAERYFAEREIFPIDWYVDDGVSGTVPMEERPEGQRLLADARAGRFDTLYIYKVDRLGRNALVTLQAATDLASCGVLLQSMTESIDNQTPHGYFSLVTLCGVAGYERDNIVARSIEGTNRLAREGAWLGGIVPFGYRVDGQGRRARLIVANDPLPGMTLSEADVVRLIYQLSAEQSWSCQKIADRLNELQVPTVYVRDERAVQRGKRTQRTSGLWRAGRIRNLITNTTYKGIHRYGKRAAKARAIIEREVPAIVPAEHWEAAQQSLHRNLRFSPRNTRRQYLLRGLMTCGLCGLTYTGASWSRVNGSEAIYYRCNGRSQGRGLYGKQAQLCPSPAVSGEIESLVWADIDGFLRNPGDVIRELVNQVHQHHDEADNIRLRVTALAREVEDLSRQRDLVVGLYRRGRIDAEALERQLDQIDADEVQLRTDLGKMEARAQAAEEKTTRLRTAEDLLQELHERLNEPLSWERKRHLVELLVDRIHITPATQDGTTGPVAEVTYSFTPITTRRDRDSWRPPAQKHHNRPIAARFELAVSLPQQGCRARVCLGHSSTAGQAGG